MKKYILISLLFVLNAQTFALEKEQYEKLIDTIKFEVTLKFFETYFEKNQHDKAKIILDSLKGEKYYSNLEGLIGKYFPKTNTKLLEPINELKGQKIQKTNISEFIFNTLKEDFPETKSSHYLTLIDEDLKNKINAILDRNFSSPVILEDTEIVQTSNHTDEIQLVSQNKVLDEINKSLGEQKEIINKLNSRITIFVILLIIILGILITKKTIRVLRIFGINIGENEEKTSLDDFKIEIAKKITQHLKYGNNPRESDFEEINKKIEQIIQSQTEFQNLIEYLKNEYDEELNYQATHQDIIEAFQRNYKKKFGGGGSGFKPVTGEEPKITDYSPKTSLNEDNPEECSTFYLSSPHSEGIFRDKDKSIKPKHDSLFQFQVVSQGSSKTAEFTIHSGNEKMIMAAIADTPNYLDGVCIQKSKASHGRSRIKTIKPGKAYLNSNMEWEVKKDDKAEIEIY